MAITVMQIDETMKIAKRFVDAGAAARKAFNDQRNSPYGVNCPKESGGIAPGKYGSHAVTC